MLTKPGFGLGALQFDDYLRFGGVHAHPDFAQRLEGMLHASAHKVQVLQTAHLPLKYGVVCIHGNEVTSPSGISAIFDDIIDPPREDGVKQG